MVLSFALLAPIVPAPLFVVRCSACAQLGHVCWKGVAELRQSGGGPGVGACVIRVFVSGRPSLAQDFRLEGQRHRRGTKWRISGHARAESFLASAPLKRLWRRLHRMRLSSGAREIGFCSPRAPLIGWGHL